MSAVRDQVLVIFEAREGVRGVEAPGRMVTRLKGEVLVVGELARVGERLEGAMKKWASPMVTGLGSWDQRAAMTEILAAGSTARRWKVRCYGGEYTWRAKYSTKRIICGRIR
jgi:hypothetical protein